MNAIVPDSTAERIHCCRICMAEAYFNGEKVVAEECEHRLEELEAETTRPEDQ